MEKRKNCWVIPTDKPSRLCKSKITQKLSMTDVLSFYGDETYNQHIYITDNSEINDQEVHLCTKYNQLHSHKYRNNTDTCKKIILTDNQDLIADGVQAIDDEFLEWFVKNPSCESVEVKLNYLGSKCLKCGYIENHDEVDTNCCPKCSNTTYKHLYENKIIIPKEEPKQCCDSGIVNDFCINTLKCKHAVGGSKQETLEEAKQRVLKANYMSANDGDIFEMGAKWQAERSYSEEEVVELLQWLTDDNSIYSIMYGHKKYRFSTNDKDFTSKEILKQYKKK